MNFEDLLNDFLSWSLKNGIKLILGIIILVVGWKLIKKVITTLNNFLEKKGFDSTLHSFLDALINIALKTLLIFVVLQFMGIEIAGLAAIVASAGFTIGLALQGSLSNFSGGVILLLMRPFKVGDYIETSGHSGTVENIKIFYTHLVTPDNKEIMIPNGTIANNSMINYTNKDTRRVDLTFGVGYEDDILHVKQTLFKIIEANDKILNHPEPFVSICEHGPSSLNFVVRVWTKTEDYWNVYFYLLEEAKIKFDEEKINIPYPQLDIHMK